MGGGMGGGKGDGRGVFRLPNLILGRETKLKRNTIISMPVN